MVNRRFGPNLAAEIRKAEARIAQLREMRDLTRRQERELERLLALRDHRGKISRRELVAKIRAGWR